MGSTRAEVARRFLEEVLGRGDYELMDALVVDGYADRSLPDGVTPRMAIEAFRGGFPDAAVSIEHQVEGDDTVVTRWVATGTHTGEFFGIPATGRRMTMEGFSEYRFEGDRMAESWVVYDQLGLLRQIGAVAA